MTTNTLFGLTTASQLQAMTKDRDYWKQMLTDTNDAIERFQIENKQLKKQLESTQKDLAESKAWAKHLEETNKEQTELIAKQQSAITQALDEAAQTAMLRNEITVQMAQQKLAIRIAIDNFNLATKDI